MRNPAATKSILYAVGVIIPKKAPSGTYKVILFITLPRHLFFTFGRYKSSDNTPRVYIYIYIFINSKIILIIPTTMNKLYCIVRSDQKFALQHF